MGYWLIVIMIALGGILVLLAAALAVDGDTDGSPSGSTSATLLPSSRPRPQQPMMSAPVPVFVLLPRQWNDADLDAFVRDIPGLATSVAEIDRGTFMHTAEWVETHTQDLEDAVVTVVAGVDDFLRGESLDVALEHLKSLLDRLSELPAMAVVASLPGIGSMPSVVDLGVSHDSIVATLTVWNQAIEDVAASYSAEYADVTGVPIELFDPIGERSSGLTSICPDVVALVAALEPVIAKAADRVRSSRTDSC